MMLIEDVCIALGILGIVFGTKCLLNVLLEHNKNESKKFAEKLKKESKKKSSKAYRAEASHIENLMKMFTDKREEAKTLIEIDFPAPQLTNDKFLQEIEEIDKNFFKIYNSLQYFLSFYPVRDERGEKIILNEEKKLRGLYDRLVNILSELAILSLRNDCNINFDDIEEEMERDSEEISNYSSGELKKSFNKKDFRFMSSHTALGTKEPLRFCQNCKNFDRVGTDILGVQMGYCGEKGRIILEKNKCCENYIKRL